MPTPSQVHVDKPLTDVSVAFMQDQDAFISSMASPVVPVSKQSDVYYEYPLESFYSTSAQPIEDGQESPTIDYDVNTKSYRARVHGAQNVIGNQERANADDQFDLDAEATEQVTRDLLIEKENDWHDTFWGTSIWDNEPTISDAWDTTSGTPIQDVSAEIETIEGNTGFRPNTFIASAPVMRAIMNNDNVIDRIKYTQSATADSLRNAVANVLDVDNVFMTRAVENTAAEGADASMGYIASDNALLVHIANSPGLRTPSAMYTFAWNDPHPNAAENGLMVRQYRKEERMADVIDARWAYDHKLVSSALGSFFDSLLS